MKHGKKYVDSFKAIDKAKQYDAPEALELAAKGAKAKFDETIELHIRLGVDSRRPTTPIMSGEATTTSKSIQFSFVIFSTRSMPPT